MKSILSIAIFVGFLSYAACQPLPLADPFILLHNNTYYAYGTHADNGIEVYTSDDLKHWKYSGLALKKGDVWGNHWFWAPEIYKAGDEFIMYYSAEEHICAARSKSPLGPFKQNTKAPMLPEKAIDHTLFIDSDGTPRIYFSRLRNGNEIWTAELERDLVSIKQNTLKFCIKAEQPWELVEGRVNEGAAVIKHGNKYFLTYSGNGYTCCLYGIGCATADSPEGPWVKDARNPLLQKPGLLCGVGHHTIFKDKEGKLKIAFHAHKNAREVHHRTMHITDAWFQAGQLIISTDYTSAILVK